MKSDEELQKDLEKALIDKLYNIHNENKTLSINLQTVKSQWKDDCKYYDNVARQWEEKYNTSTTMFVCTTIILMGINIALGFALIFE